MLQLKLQRYIERPLLPAFEPKLDREPSLNQH